MLTSLSVGACSGSTGDCAKGSGIPSYDFDQLIPNLDPTQFSVESQIPKMIHEYGDWMALLVLVIWMVQLFLTLATLVITWIQDGPTVVIAMIYTMFCASKIKRDKVLRRKRRRTQGEEPEQLPLQSAPSERYDVPEADYTQPAPMYSSQRPGFRPK